MATHTAESIPVDLASIRPGDAVADLQLKPYDQMIFKVTSKWAELDNIVLAGGVRFPGKYPIHRGETHSSVPHRTSPFAPSAKAQINGTPFSRRHASARARCAGRA
jgi:hypothetical protein